MWGPPNGGSNGASDQAQPGGSCGGRFAELTGTAANRYGRRRAPLPRARQAVAGATRAGWSPSGAGRGPSEVVDPVAAEGPRTCLKGKLAAVSEPKPPGPRAWERAELLVPRLVGAEPELISDGGGLAFASVVLAGRPQPLDPADLAVAALLAQLAGERPRLRLPWSRRPPEADAEQAAREAAAALSGWRELARTDGEVLFGRNHPPHLLTVAIRRDPRRGRWLVAGISRGKRLRAARDGTRASSWRLDPNFDAAPADTELRILVTEQRRSGGKRADGRFLEPDLYVGAEKLILTIFISPLPVVAIQGTNPETPVRIQLPEPIGGRVLIDGALYGEAPTG